MGNSKMNARERIDYLFDDHSFVEVGGYVSARNTDYNLGAKKVEGDGVITGYGVINDRMVYIYSQDASALGGSVGEMHAKKIASLYDLAMKTGAPIIGMLDCAGLRLQEATDALHAFGTIFNKQAQASGMIPQISAVFGMCGGGSAVMSAMSDFTLMEKENGSLFINSPNALAGNEESRQNTAGAQFQSEQAGNVDFVCETEEALLDQLRILVDVLPSDYEAEDVYFDNDDDLNRVIPELNDAAYDAAYILKSISDNNMYIETKAAYAKEMVTAFIRLNGETVGAVANQPVDGESVLTRNGLEKAERPDHGCLTPSLVGSPCSTTPPYMERMTSASPSRMAQKSTRSDNRLLAASRPPSWCGLAAFLFHTMLMTSSPFSRACSTE